MWAQRGRTMGLLMNTVEVNGSLSKCNAFLVTSSNAPYESVRLPHVLQSHLWSSTILNSKGESEELPKARRFTTIHYRKQAQHQPPP